MNQRVVRSLAFRAPAVGDCAAACLRGLLRILDRIGATSAWRRVMNALLGYWYERGLADVLESPAGVEALLSTGNEHADGGALDVDLACGLDAALRRVEDVRPRGVSMRFGERLIGEITATPGAEPLAARHVEAALVTQFNEVYVRALVGANHPDYDRALAHAEPPCG
jgi:hypothetical protein